MDKLRSKALKREKKKPDQTVPSKKKKCEGSTCSTFFSDLTRKFKMKKKSKEETSNIANSKKIDSMAKPLPIEHSIKTLETTDPSIEEKFIPNDISKSIVTQKRIPEHIDDLTIKPKAEKITTRISFDNLGANKITPIIINPKMRNNSLQTEIAAKDIETSKMLVDHVDNSEQMVINLQNIEPGNVSTNSMKECDIAGELTKHVNTLRRISLIADEFNKKTAKNLKEIVDSVSEDLVKKLEEVKAEQARSPTPEKKIVIN